MGKQKQEFPLHETASGAVASCDSDCVPGKAKEECLHPEHRALGLHEKNR